MKKLIALCLTAVMLLMTCAALAEGPLTEKPINFGKYTLGQLTLQELKENALIDEIDYVRGYLPISRVFGDVRSFFASAYSLYEPIATHLVVDLYENDPAKVAGYDNFTQDFYFLFPLENGHFVNDDDRAVLFAGYYQFYTWDMDANAVFEDLKGKLTSTYGEPWMETKTADDIWGPLEATEDIKYYLESEDYAESRYDPSYVVWKSSANGCMAILRLEKSSWDDDYSVSIVYVDPSMDETFAAMLNTPSEIGGSVTNSTEGL